MLRAIRNAMIAMSRRTPYFHLHHADGSPYMRRFWLMPRFALVKLFDRFNDAPGYELRGDVRWLPAMRLHNIVTPDLDRELHNHPWSFVSIVLSGGYVERRPIHDRPVWFRPLSPLELPATYNAALDRGKLIDTLVGPPLIRLDEEPGYDVKRGPGSIAFRSYRDRHRIVHVEPDTWTLIIQGPKRQSWGFFTERGFVNWRDFESVHNKEAIR